MRPVQWPKQILKKIKGYLQTDAYKSYECFIVNEPTRDLSSIAQAISINLFKKHIPLYLEFFQTNAEGFCGNCIKAAEAADKLSV